MAAAAANDDQIVIPDLFWQDQHDHPLPLVYSGDKCEAFVYILSEIFGPERTFELPSVSLTEIMNVLMPIHFANNHLEYFAYLLIPNGVFIAFNHNFHDAYSAGMLMKRNFMSNERTCYIPPNVHKKTTAVEPDFIPVKVSTLKVNKRILNNLKSSYDMTQNEAAFLIASTVLSKNFLPNPNLKIKEESEVANDNVKKYAVKQSISMTCMHNMRRYFGEEGKQVGGDYTCSSEPFTIHQYLPNDYSTSTDEATTTTTGTTSSTASNRIRQELPLSIKEYLHQVKIGTLVTQSSDAVTDEMQQNKYWVFDTWINSGLGQPGNHPSSSFQLSFETLMSIFAVVCRNFIIVVDIGDDILFSFFSNDIRGSLSEEDYASYWLKD